MTKEVRSEFLPFFPPGSQVRSSECEREELEGEDQLGNTGTTILVTTTASAYCESPGEELRSHYEREGFTELPADSFEEDDRARVQKILADPSNPFLLEHVVRVGIRWRELLPGHRAALEKKRAELAALVSGGRKSKRRRARAAQMLEDLEEGLLSRLELRSTRRLFRMDPFIGNGTPLGKRVPLSRMDQLVYRVEPREKSEEDDEPAEPMYLTILGTDDFRVAFLFSGGILGQRVVTDLEEGVAHHAWFQNRRSVLTDDTAPWVSRSLFRELKERGESEMVVRWGRDEAPIPVRRTGEDEIGLRTPAGERQVPVLVAETAKEDRLWILEDPESPLVLRLVETGADLLRTVDEVRRLEEF
jgi:hypothetical protein